MIIQKEELANQNTVANMQESSELATNKQPLDDNSPLLIVREKEIELKKYLIKTQSEADKIIEEAKKEAEKLKEKINIEGEKKAEEHFKSELAKINMQAEEIRSTAPAKAKEAQQAGLKNLDKAIDEIRNILIPKIN